MPKLKPPARTKPDPCTKKRGFAHEWTINSPDGERYVWGSCRHCQRRRLFRTSWPAKLDWNDERKKRKEEESKKLRQEARAKTKKKVTK